MTEHSIDDKSPFCERSVQGHGLDPPTVKWPNNAKVALNFVIDYEGGDECLLLGENGNKDYSAEVVDGVPLDGKRDLNMESFYDYGSRAGFWRLYRLFVKHKLPCTLFAVGMALQRNPIVCYELRKNNDWEVSSRGYRYTDYQSVDEDTERDNIKRSIQVHDKLLGKRPVGFFSGKPNTNTRRLVVEEGGFKYDSDSYADDLPYWSMDHNNRIHLVIPYSLTENDSRFASPHGFVSSQHFLRHLKDTLLSLVEDGQNGKAKMMTVVLHSHFARPAHVAAVSEFIEFIKVHSKDVWICKREEIADHWIAFHSPRGRGSKVTSPKGMTALRHLFLKP